MAVRMMDDKEGLQFNVELELVFSTFPKLKL
jgi:hypothetical protein